MRTPLIVLAAVAALLAGPPVHADNPAERFDRHCRGWTSGVSGDRSTICFRTASHWRKGRLVITGTRLKAHTYDDNGRPGCPDFENPQALMAAYRVVPVNRAETVYGDPRRDVHDFYLDDCINWDHDDIVLGRRWPCAMVTFVADDVYRDLAPDDHDVWWQRKVCR